MEGGFRNNLELGWGKDPKIQPDCIWWKGLKCEDPYSFPDTNMAGLSTGTPEGDSRGPVGLGRVDQNGKLFFPALIQASRSPRNNVLAMASYALFLTCLTSNWLQFLSEINMKPAQIYESFSVAILCGLHPRDIVALIMLFPSSTCNIIQCLIDTSVLCLLPNLIPLAFPPSNVLLSIFTNLITLVESGIKIN